MNESKKPAASVPRDPQVEDRVNFLAILLCVLAFIAVGLALALSS